MNILDRIIQESINNYIDNTIVDSVINESILSEISKAEKKEKKNIKRLKRDAFDAMYRGKKSSKDKLKRLPKDLDNYKKEDKKDNEDKPKKSKKNSGEKSVAKNAKKLKNGLRTDFNVKQDKLTNPNLNNQDSEDLSDILDNPAIDLAAVAKKVYPDHTAQGAQSQLRKKVKGLKSDSGSKYKIKKKEAYKLRRILLNLIK